MTSPTLLSRRRLLRCGVAGATAVIATGTWLAVEDEAMAAQLQPVLKRSTWNALHEPRLTATCGPMTAVVTLVAVSDLGAAATVPGLRGHDGAFTLRFEGPPGLAEGLTTLSSPELGTAELFLSPVEAVVHRDRRAYEAVVDRTVRIAGVNEEGTPEPVVPPAVRAAADPAPLPASATAAGVAPTAPPTRGARKPKVPQVRRASLRPGASGRRAVVELSLAGTRDVVGVRVALLAGTTEVAKAFSSERTPHRLRLVLPTRSGLGRRRYQLVVRLIARDGAITTVRRTVRPA